MLIFVVIYLKTIILKGFSLIKYKCKPTYPPNLQLNQSLFLCLQCQPTQTGDIFITN